LAESLGYRAHFVSVDAPDAPKRYGNAILTRHPILRAGGRNLDPKNDYRVVAHLRLDVRGRPVDVYDTHLHHTSEGGAIRAEQIRDLLAFVDSTRGDADLVLAGDFNAELGSPEMRPIEDAYLDAYAATHPGPRGPEAVTLNERLGNPPRAIDHIFVPRADRGPRGSASVGASAPGLRPLDCAILFRDPGPDSVWASDHFGVVARLLRPVRK
jgi:endonuclease/exonuclease/phosphatase family metal-dependent hydrolase